MNATIHQGDCIEVMRTLDAGSIQTCVTSPPYWGLRDYGVDGQIGLESTPEAYIARMVEVFREVRRVLRDDGTLWLNLGDSYAAGKCGRSDSFDGRSIDGKLVTQKQSEEPTTRKAPEGLKPKDLCMIPWRVALALQADGWWLRSVIVWAKKSPMPESVTDRPTSSWEPIFLLAKSERYFYDAEAVRQPHAQASIARARTPDNERRRSSGTVQEMGVASLEWQPEQIILSAGGANLRNVWHLGPEPYAEAHFATFPTEIPRRCILAGTSEKGQCPACGAGWVRVIEKPTMMKVDPSDLDRFGNGTAGVHRKVGQAYQDWRDANPDKTVGWSPSCSCNAGDPVPQIVLDPFNGSGTTGAVAVQHGRNYVGIELNPAYIELAKDRIGKARNPATYQSNKAVDAPLFGVTS